MARKRPKRSSVIKRLCVIAAVLGVVAAAHWAATMRIDDTHNWILTPSVALVVMSVLAIALWAMGEQFWFSFGKSRYLTRTEKKRLQHQRKKGDGATEILGRKIPQKNRR